MVKTMAVLKKRLCALGIIATIGIVFARNQDSILIHNISEKEFAGSLISQTPIAPSWVPVPKSEERVESGRLLTSELSLEKPSLHFHHDTSGVGESDGVSYEPLRSSMMPTDLSRSHLPAGPGRRGRGRRGRGGRMSRGSMDGGGSSEADEGLSSSTSNNENDESSSSNDAFLHAQSIESPSVLQGREANLAKIRERKGTILFTHIRRAGGKGDHNRLERGIYIYIDYDNTIFICVYMTIHRHCVRRLCVETLREGTRWSRRLPVQRRPTG
jgi:hypothetical protein